MAHKDQPDVASGPSITFLLSFLTAAAAAAKSLQLCPTLCDPIDSSPPGSPVPGILQARTLEWVAISFSTTLPFICSISTTLASWYREGNGNPLQYSCLENPMDRGAW